MYGHRIIVVLVPFMLLALLFINQPAKATAWDALSYCPSSVNEYWSEAGVPITPPINSWAVRELCPAVGSYVDIYSSEYVYRSVAVNNWSWIRYSGFDDPADYITVHPPGSYGNETYVPGGSISGTLGIDWDTINASTVPNVPITTDDIISVQAVTYWIGARSPSFFFSLSENGGTTYPHNSFTKPAYWDDWPKLVTWNMTTERAWTPADFTSPDIFLKIEMELMPGVHYQLDYLGIVVQFKDNTAGSGTSYSIGDIYLDISGSFGVIGFIGMTICPAYAVMQWRQGGDGRVIRLIMSIGAMLVFFTLFLASLGA